MPDTQLIDGSSVSLQQLLDLFLYYAHRRENKVVKGLTDTLYTTREKSTYVAFRSRFDFTCKACAQAFYLARYLKVN